MVRWTGLAPWECESPFPGSLTSTFLSGATGRDAGAGGGSREGDFLIDNLLVRIHFIIVMILWTGLAPFEFEFPFPGATGSDAGAGGGTREGDR